MVEDADGDLVSGVITFTGANGTTARGDAGAGPDAAGHADRERRTGDFRAACVR